MRESPAGTFVRMAMTRVALGATVGLVLILVGAASPSSAQRRAPTPADVERARALFHEGSEHYRAGRLDEALARFLPAWRLVPSPELAYNVARTSERMGDARRAVEFYRHYLQQAEPDADERRNVERRIAELEAVARRQREQIAATPPSHDELTEEARTFFERGVAMFRRRRYEAALAAFTAAYRFARLPEVVYNLAVTSERLGRTQDAIDYFREYTRALPQDNAERQIIERRIAALRARRN